MSVGDHDTSTLRDGSRYKLVYAYRPRGVSHPEYTSGSDSPAFDVAVLRLRVGLRFGNDALSRRVSPVCLPSPYQFRQSGRAIVAGWGNVEFEGWTINCGTN